MDTHIERWDLDADLNKSRTFLVLANIRAVRSTGSVSEQSDVLLHILYRDGGCQKVSLPVFLMTLPSRALS